jgi:hypothetical protein
MLEQDKDFQERVIGYRNDYSSGKYSSQKLTLNLAKESMSILNQYRYDKFASISDIAFRKNWLEVMMEVFKKYGLEDKLREVKIVYSKIPLVWWERPKGVPVSPDLERSRPSG